MPYRVCGSNWTSNQRNTARITLYCTWRPSVLATGLCRQSFTKGMWANLQARYDLFCVKSAVKPQLTNQPLLHQNPPVLNWGAGKDRLICIMAVTWLLACSAVIYVLHHFSVSWCHAIVCRCCFHYCQNCLNISIQKIRAVSRRHEWGLQLCCVKWDFEVHSILCACMKALVMSLSARSCEHCCTDLEYVLEYKHWPRICICTSDCSCCPDVLSIVCEWAKISVPNLVHKLTVQIPANQW